VSEPVTERKWRTFADVVAFALGTNVWVSIVILPAIFVGALHGAGHVLAALLPFAVLLLGLWRRSEGILLGLFPAAVLVPVSIQPQLASSYVYGPVRFGLVAIGVIAYLFGVSFFTTFHEPPAPRSIRMLSSAHAGPATRWRRRERVYWGLTVMSIIIPTVLIVWVNYDDAIADYLGEMYPGRVALMRPHRTGDRDLVSSLTRTRVESKAGKPRTRFYLSVAIALVAMLSLILFRHL